jgi:NAD(P)H-dependent flavin oxidoreductase YrpB (nitropropane dioxygenase family)
MLETAFTRLVGCTVPLQQAGMGGVATPDLAAAVADAGALGMINMVMAPATAVEAALEGLAKRTSGVFGINFLMPFVDIEAVEAAASRCRLVEFFYGDPQAELVDRVHRGGALAAWQVGSRHEAGAAVDAGCDLIMLQGTEAGGHIRGTVSMFTLLDDVLGTVDVPVLAAGGIGSARAMAAALAAGADGVRVGTRFVAATESGAHPDYVEALRGASAADTVITGAFSVMWPDAPHRVLRSCVEALDAFDGDVVGEMEMGPARVPIPRGAVPSPLKDTTGTIAAMPMYAGESVSHVVDVEPAAAVVRELADGAERLLRAWA